MPAPDLKSLLPEWIRNLTPYPPGMPVEELERRLGISGSIKLASNENPLGPSPRAVEAVAAALAGIHRYPDGSAFHLTRRIAERLGVPPDHVLVGNGSNELLDIVTRTFVRQGDEAVMADQAFVIYRMIVQAAGGRPRTVPLRGFTHDLEAMADAVGPGTRIVFLANPNNPTGTIYRRAAWEDFLAAIPPWVVVVADDAYAEYVDDPEYPDSIACRRPDRLVLTLRTFSKVYGLAGLRIGYGVGPPELIAALARVRQPFSVNALAQVAALAALDDEEHVRRTLEVNRQGLAYLYRECERLGLAYVPSHANFLLVHVGRGTAVYEALLRDGVIVRPMAMYGLGEYIRVTVGTMEENHRFVASLERVLARLGARGAERSPGST